MNGKKAKALRKAACYDPHDPRPYQKTIMPGSIKVISEQVADVRRFFGYGVLTTDEAAELGLKDPGEGNCYAFSYGPTHVAYKGYRDYKKSKAAA